MGYKYIFMYNGFDKDIDAKMAEYLKNYFDKYHFFINGEGQLWVREDVYDYVFAIINAHAVYDESEEFTIYNIEDCNEWKLRQISKGLVNTYIKL
jgi:hypothetical protein